MNAAADRVRTGELVHGSALALARAGQGRLRRLDRGPGAGLELAELPGLLYVPRAMDTGQGLQVLPGTVLPVESVFDDYIAAFLRGYFECHGVAELDGFEDDQGAGPVCVLGNAFARNFTHWHEELMKVLVLEGAGIECRYVLSQLPAFALESLRMLGIPDERILLAERPLRFATALYTTPVSYRNVFDHPAVLTTLREALLAHAQPGPARPGRRVWLDRGSQTRLGRALVNREEVEALLDRYGFERIDMGALPLPAQIATARDIAVMAGAHGSAFVHAQLMAPRSHVIEAFSPLYLNPTYTEIYRVLRHRYSQLGATNQPVVPYAHGRDVYIDCQQLDLALANACE